MYYSIKKKREREKKTNCKVIPAINTAPTAPYPPRPGPALSLLPKRTAWGGGGGTHRRAKPSTAAAGGCGRRPGGGAGVAGTRGAGAGCRGAGAGCGAHCGPAAPSAAQGSAGGRGAGGAACVLPRRCPHLQSAGREAGAGGGVWAEVGHCIMASWYFLAVPTLFFPPRGQLSGLLLSWRFPAASKASSHPPRFPPSRPPPSGAAPCRRGAPRSASPRPAPGSGGWGAAAGASATGSVRGSGSPLPAGPFYPRGACTGLAAAAKGSSATPTPLFEGGCWSGCGSRKSQCRVWEQEANKRGVRLLKALRPY